MVCGCGAAGRRAGCGPDGPALVVVDDLVTTGASLTEAARCLVEAGFEVLGAATVSATVRTTVRLLRTAEDPPQGIVTGAASWSSTRRRGLSVTGEGRGERARSLLLLEADMDVVVKSRHCTVSDTFRDYVEDKITRLEKLDDRVIRVEVEVSAERNRRQHDQASRVEITLRTKGPVVRAEAARRTRPPPSTWRWTS